MPSINRCLALRPLGQHVQGALDGFHQFEIEDFESELAASILEKSRMSLMTVSRFSAEFRTIRQTGAVGSSLVSSSRPSCR